MAKKKELTPEEKIQQAIVPKEEQPYPLPEGWRWVRLGDIAEWGSGGTPSRKIASYYRGNIPWLKTGDLNNGYIFSTEEHISEDALTHSSAKLFPVNTVIVAMYGATIGKVGILRIEAATNQACACGIPWQGVNYKYLFYYIQSQADNFIRKSKGGAQPNISQNIIKKHVFPLPPFYEQEKIVEKIGQLFNKLEKVKSKIQYILNLSEQRKAAILHKAFTGELTAIWRQERQITLNSWENKKISEVCDIVRGGSPRPAGSPEFYGGNIPFMKVADITRNASPFVTTTESFIKEAGLKRTRVVEKNTLLLTNSGATLGVPAICTFKTAFNDGIAAFLGLNPKSIKFYYYFWSSKTNKLRTINKGAAQPNLNTKIIGNIMHRVPTIEEQQEIVRVLDNFFEKEKYIVDMTYRSLQDIEILKKSILEKAFRGGLSI